MDKVVIVSASSDFIPPSTISNVIHYTIAQPDRVAVNEIVVRPVNREL